MSMHPTLRVEPSFRRWPGFSVSEANTAEYADIENSHLKTTNVARVATTVVDMIHRSLSQTLPPSAVLVCSQNFFKSSHHIWNFSSYAQKGKAVSSVSDNRSLFSMDTYQRLLIQRLNDIHKQSTLKFPRTHFTLLIT